MRMIKPSMCLLLSYLTISCVSLREPAPSATASASPSPTTNDTPTATFALTETHIPTFAASSTPTVTATLGPTQTGIAPHQIAGVFVSEESPVFQAITGTCNYILRFYDDGLVMGVTNCTELPTILDALPQIDGWFNRESKDDGLSRGKYHLSENHIWFVTTSQVSEHPPGVEVDYSGTYDGNHLVLDSYSFATKYPAIGAKYVRLSTD